MISSPDNYEQKEHIAHEQFDVIFTGEILEGKQKKEVCAALEKRLKTSRENINRLFSKAPFIIKNNCSKRTAASIQTAFANAGAVCIISANKKEKTPIRKDVSVDEAIEILRDSLIPDNEEPTISASDLPVKPLFLRYISTLFSSLFIVGLFTGPQKIISYIADSLSINGEKLVFQSYQAFAVPITFTIIGSYIYYLLLSFIVHSLYTLFIKALIIFTGICFYPVIPGIGIILLINYVITGTTLNGFRIGEPLFSLTLTSVFSYVNEHFRNVYLYGSLALLSVIGASPVLTAIILHKWYTSFNISGKKYTVPIPWQPVILGTFMNVLSLGLYLPKSTATIHRFMHKHGSWHDLYEKENNTSTQDAET